MQRIESGRLGGRRLRPLPRAASDVRPTAAKTRAAIFDRLQAEVVGARVLDLYAGSGALAIEALSRGARVAVLVERQRVLVDHLMRQLDELGLRSAARVVADDVARMLSRPPPAEAPFELVLIDPPYRDVAGPAAAMAALVRPGWLAPDAVVVVETGHEARAAEPGDVAAIPAAFALERARDYGQTRVEFWRFEPGRDGPSAEHVARPAPLVGEDVDPG